MQNFGTAFPGRVTPPDPNYPYGSAKDETGEGVGDGSPMVKSRSDDFIGFQQALMTRAGIVPSGNSDTALVCQLYNAIVELLVLRAGRTGGEIIYGGVDASDDLAIESTSNATKGRVNLQPNGGGVNIGDGSSTHDLDIFSEDPGVSLFNTTIPSTTAIECFSAHFMRDAADGMQKVSSISTIWADLTALAEVACLRLNAAYMDGAVQKDDLFLLGFGDKGVQFWPPTSFAPPGSKILEINGLIRTKYVGVDDLGGTSRTVARFFDDIQSKGLALGYDNSSQRGTIYSQGSSSGIDFITHDGSSFASRIRINTSGSILLAGLTEITHNPGVGSSLADIGSSSFASVQIFEDDSYAPSSAATTIKVGMNTGTGRSINATGTVNASGADYAEYEKKSESCGDILKGGICGFDKNGEVTDKFFESISFGIKSTDPALVGGDDWSKEITPNLPVKPTCDTNKYLDRLKLTLPEAPVMKKGDSKNNAEKYEADLKRFEDDTERILDKVNAEFKIDMDKYEKDYNAFSIALEKERIKYDRIAYSGKVPVNITSGNVGDYVVPVNKSNKISGVSIPKTDVTFDQLKIAVGQIRKKETGEYIVKVL